MIGLRIGQSLFSGAFLLGFGVAAVAATIGIAAIIGAFLAGMALAEATEKEHETHEPVRGVTEFFTPFFLVSIGMQLNLEAFTSRETIVASLVITVLAVAPKFVGCGLASIRLCLRRAAQIGIGDR